MKEIILGIDPGSRLCGWGLVLKKGNSHSLITAGTIDIRAEGSNEKLIEIYDRIQNLIVEYKPTIAAIESPFFHKNAQTLIKLSHARAAAILAISKLGIPLAEFSPLEVKKSLTGRGRADKSQVAFMVSKILGCDLEGLNDDATDALAIAICRAFKEKGTEAQNKSRGNSNWATYIKENPTLLKRG